jgi:hypothetical protein
MANATTPFVFLDEAQIYSGDYVAPTYVFTTTVKNFALLPRFGHGSDFTVLFSPDRVDQVDYAAGLVALFVFLLMFFIFWIIMIATFKAMGPMNAGFLSGHPFVVPDPADDETNICKRYVSRVSSYASLRAAYAQMRLYR